MAIAIGGMIPHMHTGPVWQQPIESALIGQSPEIRVVKEQIGRLAPIDITTLIQGQSGTGKELVARLIHHHSPRRSKPWVAINCGAIPSDLFESELFGHCEGAFTGANRRKKGLFQMAHRGTVFLDEVGELPLVMQVKLLRVIEERSIRPLGSETEHPIDIRLIAASHRDLGQMVEQGHFRIDLYHRLKVAQIDLPCLRDISRDLPQLISFFLDQVAKELKLPVKPITDRAHLAFQRHLFKGNIRELKHCLSAALLWSTGPKIDIEDLPLRSPSGIDETRPDESLDPCQSLDDSLQRTERALIHRALSENHQNHRAAARQLQISERSLRYRLKKHQQ